MKRFTILTLIMLMLCYSCTKNKDTYANQNLIHTIYELSYDKSKDKSIARAAFKLGSSSGTLVQVYEPAIIQFNNDDMPFSTVTRSHQMEYNGYIDAGFFFYKDYEDNYYNNTLPVMDTIGFPEYDTISISSIFTLMWTGIGVDENQKVYLYIDGPNAGTVDLINETLGSNKFEIEASKFQSAGLGDCTLTLKREYRRNSVDQGTTAGGRMAYYYSNSKQFYIRN